MYTVLLVDDDTDVLHFLEHNIDWSVYGFAHILTACDGVEALEQLANHAADLLITDISMPRMDGITLFKEVKVLHPHTRCIFLSSYSDFAYAREAISLGVENYLLKPIQKDELELSIRKSLDNMSMHKQTLRALFLDNVLSRWLNNDITEEELAERSRHINVNIYFRNYCVLLLKSSHLESTEGLLTDFLSGLQSSYHAYHFVDYNGHRVIILGGHTLIQKDIQEKLTRSIQKTNFTKDLCAVIGVIAKGSEQASLSYQSARDALLLYQALPGTNTYLAEHFEALDVSDYQLGQIVEYMKAAMDIETEPESPQTLFTTLFAHTENYPLSEVNDYFNMLSIRLFRLLIHLGLIDATAEESLINIYQFEKYPTMDVLYLCFNKLLGMNIILMKKHMNRLSPICILAMQYVANNFADHVSIKDFCDKNRMNASYFGFLFKKETGIFFHDYISQIRINHAMMLLKNTNYKTSQLSTMCGFSSTSYFILCFKKRTGLSPAAFKQLLTQKESGENA